MEGVMGTDDGRSRNWWFQKAGKLDKSERARSELGLATTTSAIAAATVAVAGLARYKLVSSAFGPAGLALFGQLLAFSGLLRLLGGLGSSGGITRLLATSDASAPPPSTVVRTAFLGLLVPVVLLVLGFLLAYQALASFTFADEAPGRWLLLALPCLPLAAAGSVVRGLLQAREQYRLIAVVDGLVALLGLALLAALILRGELWTLGWYPLLFVVLQTGLLVGLGRTQLRLDRRNGHARFDFGVLRQILAFGIAGWLGTIGVAVTSILLGRHFLAFGQGDTAGYFRAFWLVSETLLAVSVAAFHSYFFPMFCREDADGRGQHALAGIARSFLTLAGPLLLATSLLASPFLALLFRTDFTQVAGLLSVELCATLLRGCAWILGIPLLARHRLRWLVGLNLTWCASMLVLNLGLFADASLETYVLIHLGTSAVLLIAEVVVVGLLTGLYPSRAIGLRFLLVLAALGGLAWFHRESLGYWVGGGAALLIAMVDLARFTRRSPA